MNDPANEPDLPRGVLLTSNLLFSTMVTGTATAIGREVAVAADVAEAVELCRARPTACLIIDLAMPELDVASTLAQLREAAGPVPAIAFGAHVDKARLDAARSAGCTEVLPRSRFHAELPELLKRYVTGDRG